MPEAAWMEERARSMPIQEKANEQTASQGRFTPQSPYNGIALPITGKLAGKIRDSFGIDASELSLRESPDVAGMGAAATAQGNVIRFAPGEFRPDTSEGMSVLGHELNHVREQAMGGVHAPSGELFEHPAHEAASDAAGAAFASGSLSAAEAVSPVSAGSAPVQGLFGRGRRRRGANQPAQDAALPFIPAIDSGNFDEDHGAQFGSRLDAIDTAHGATPSAAVNVGDLGGDYSAPLASRLDYIDNVQGAAGKPWYKKLWSKVKKMTGRGPRPPVENDPDFDMDEIYNRAPTTAPEESEEVKYLRRLAAAQGTPGGHEEERDPIVRMGHWWKYM